MGGPSETKIGGMRNRRGAGYDSPMSRGVIGIDSSTQSCKAVLVDPETGEVSRGTSAPHPEGTEVAPALWLGAAELALGRLGGDPLAISVAGQQHGMVCLDAHQEVVRPALLWNDTRSAPQARALVVGREKYWDESVGLRPDAALTVSKLAWMAQHEPDNLAQTETLLLPHDWLSWELKGRGEFVTDVSEASGTGYLTLRREYDRALVREIAQKDVALPRVASPTESMDGVGPRFAAGAADNAAAAFALELDPGEVVVSLGTSGTVFRVTEEPYGADRGILNFADVTGANLALVCTLNAARVLTATAEMLKVDLTTFGRLVTAAPLDADGLLLMPYLDGERFPNLPAATGSLVGVTRSNMTAEHVARAATLGMLCGIADALDVLLGPGVRPEQVLLIGGAAQSEAVREIAPAILGCAVVLPAPREYVAIGAARQAAWMVLGGDQPPQWGRKLQSSHVAPTGDWGCQVRERFRHYRNQLYTG